MPKTKREKILLAATIALFVLGLGYSQLENLDAFSGLTQTGAEIQALKAQYDQYNKVLKEKPKIEKQWKAIGQTEQRPEDQTPEMHFSLTIHEMCRNLQLPPPHNAPCEVQEIPEVKEYGLLYLPFTIKGPWPQISQLLKQLDGRGYLIDKLRVQAFTDQNEILVTVTAAQPVKLAEVSSVLGRAH